MRDKACEFLAVLTRAVVLFTIIFMMAAAHEADLITRGSEAAWFSNVDCRVQR